MRIEYLFSDAEPEPRAIGFGGVERVKDPGHAVFRNAATIITQDHCAHSATAARIRYRSNREVDPALALDLRHRVDRVVDNVREDLSKLVGIGAHDWTAEIGT